LYVPRPLERWGPLRGTPCGGRPTPCPTVANFQYEIQEMLTLAWPLRWWDAGRENLYTLAHLCQDAFGRDHWTHDLTVMDGQGRPLNRWTPPYALLLGELYAATNRLDRVRLLPTVSEAHRRDSVYRLMFGLGDWATDRAETFALFDGEDDGQTVEMTYDVGMGGEIFDDGATQQWLLESRQFRMTFATAAFADCSIRRAWLDFTTAPPAGSTDFSGTFTAQVVDADGEVRATFASNDYGPKHFEIPGESIRTGGDTVIVIRSAQADSADRPAWTPEGPDYTSTYREGLALAGPMRLIVEVDFEYRE